MKNKGQGWITGMKVITWILFGIISLAGLIAGGLMLENDLVIALACIFGGPAAAFLITAKTMIFLNLAQDVKDIKTQNNDLQSMAQNIFSIAQDVVDIKAQSDNLQGVSQRIYSIAQEVKEIKTHSKDMKDVALNMYDIAQSVGTAKNVDEIKNEMTNNL